jgi:hypothetical protein
MMQCIEAKGIQVGTRECQSKSSSTELRGLCPSGRGKVSYLCYLGSSLSVHACHPHGILPVYWACRVFSGFED